MSAMYVIMKGRQSPIAISLPRPHEVRPTLKAAKERVKELNARAANNYYWHECVPFHKDA